VGLVRYVHDIENVVAQGPKTRLGQLPARGRPVVDNEDVVSAVALLAAMVF
jgi:hypothetical protein